MIFANDETEEFIFTPIQKLNESTFKKKKRTPTKVVCSPLVWRGAGSVHSSLASCVLSIGDHQPCQRWPEEQVLLG